jgi:hypothetical protein
MRRMYRGWLRIANFLSRAMTIIVMTLVYFLIIPFFLFVRRKDPLNMKVSVDQSYWQDWLPENESLEDFYHLS